MDKSKRKKGAAREFGEAIIFAFLLALILKTFVFQLFKIPSGSMEPTLLVGDQLVVLKFAYGVHIPLLDLELFQNHTPQRGDVIVFKYPKDPSIDFIKRVIAVGGETVEVRAKKIYINGVEILDPWGVHTDPGMVPEGLYNRDYFGPVTVPEGKLFVMGDNRDDSHDSRFWGFVDLRQIKGRAWILYWSWDSEVKGLRRSRIGTPIQ
jgi:signal peptidase I